MANKNNRKCLICGKTYSYCPVCGADRKKPSWYSIFDGDNCNNIYNAVTGYRDGLFTIEEAREKLNACDLSIINSDGFNVGTRDKIKEILEINNVEPAKIEAPIVEEVPVVEAAKEVVEEKSVVETVEEVVEEKPVVDEVVEKRNNEPKKQDNFKHENKYNGNKHFYKNNK